MSTLTLTPRLVRVLPGGITSTRVMYEASKVGRIVYVGTDSLMREAAGDTNTLATGQLGLIVSGGRADPDGNVAAGEAVTVLWFGRVNLGVTLVSTTQYYLADTTSTVKGLFGDAAGTVSRRVAKPEDETGIIFFNPQDVATAS